MRWDGARKRLVPLEKAAADDMLKSIPAKAQADKRRQCASGFAATGREGTAQGRRTAVGGVTYGVERMMDATESSKSMTLGIL